MAAIMVALDEVVDLLDREAGIDALWVYGSEAAGRARADSDVDLAALFRERPAPVDLMELAGRAAALLGRPVDLVDLDGASPLLAYQVLKHGRLVADRNPSRRYRFTAGIPARREDLLIHRRPIEKQLIARMTGRPDNE